AAQEEQAQYEPDPFGEAGDPTERVLAALEERVRPLEESIQAQARQREFLQGVAQVDEILATKADWVPEEQRPAVLARGDEILGNWKRENPDRSDLHTPEMAEAALLAAAKELQRPDWTKGGSVAGMFFGGVVPGARPP